MPGGACGGPGSAGRAPSASGEPDREPEARAGPWARHHSDLAAVRFDEPLHGRQPEPDAWLALGLRQTDEGLEDLCLGAWREAGTGVLHLEVKVVVLFVPPKGDPPEAPAAAVDVLD